MLPEKPAIPNSPEGESRPSRLYSLRPIGVGTPYVESLTSYVCRLALEHCLTPGILVANLIAPILNKHWMKAVHGYVLHNVSVPINGSGITAADWVVALETLTQRNDLSYLTMVLWQEVIGKKNLLRRSRAWCSNCLSMQQESGEAIHELLLWCLSEVTVCQIHNSTLEFRCPNCYQILPTITASCKPGYCSKCFSWLGKSNLGKYESATEHEKWRAVAVGELLEAATQFTNKPNRSNIRESMRTLYNRLGLSKQTFAARSNIALRAAYDWLDGKFVPILGSIARLCETYNISIVSFIRGEINVTLEKSKTNVEAVAVSESHLPVAKNKTPRRSKMEIHELLTAALSEDPPASASELSRRIGYNKSSFFWNHKELYGKIVSRYREYKKRMKTDRIESVRISLVNALSEFPPQPMSVIRRRVKDDFLWRNSYFIPCPELCKAISKRHMEYKKQEAQKRRTEIYERISSAVKVLNARQIYPSDDQIVELTRYKRSPSFRTYARLARKEAGIPQSIR